MLGKLFERWATNRQVKEAEDFLERLRAMNSDELGLPLAVTLDAATMALDERGIDVFDPFAAIAVDPSASLYFSQMVGQLQKMGRHVLAPGPMVWTHTLRATMNHRVRELVREIWAELLRGVPHAEDARHQLLDLFGMWPDLDRLGDVPIGMERKK